MSKLSDFLALKKEVEQLRATVSRTEGAYDQLLGQLKRDFGVKSFKEAKVLLQQLTKQLEQLDSDSKSKTEAFEEKWGDRLRRGTEDSD